MIQLLMVMADQLKQNANLIGMIVDTIQPTETQGATSEKLNRLLKTMADQHKQNVNLTYLCVKTSCFPDKKTAESVKAPTFESPQTVRTAGWRTTRNSTENRFVQNTGPTKPTDPCIAVSSQIEDSLPKLVHHSALQTAVENGDTESVRSILSEGLDDPSVGSNLAFRRAALLGHEKIVLLLLNDDRVDPCACNDEAIRNASGNKHLNVVRLLATDHRVNAYADSDTRNLVLDIWSDGETRTTPFSHN